MSKETDAVAFRWVDRIGLGPVLAIVLVGALAWQNRELMSQLREQSSAQFQLGEKTAARIEKLAEAIERQARAEEAHAASAAGAGHR